MRTWRKKNESCWRKKSWNSYWNRRCCCETCQLAYQEEKTLLDKIDKKRKEKRRLRRRGRRQQRELERWTIREKMKISLR